MSPSELSEVIARIEAGLDAALEALAVYPAETVQVQYKRGDDPVTQADRAVDRVLREMLPSGHEGWLSEETTDDPRRLSQRRVWVVDPLDGTREFIAGIPEWCVSIGYVVNGEPFAGGICNPGTGERFVGALGNGVRLNGEPVAVSTRDTLRGGTVPASRSEIRRGEWKRFEEAGFAILPTGSSAYKLALVACGRAEASWTLVPKNEWDVAAGVALVRAAGGLAYLPNGRARRFNQPDPLLPGLIATSAAVADEVARLTGVAPEPGLPGLENR